MTTLCVATHTHSHTHRTTEYRIKQQKKTAKLSPIKTVEGCTQSQLSCICVWFDGCDVIVSSHSLSLSLAFNLCFFRFLREFTSLLFFGWNKPRCYIIWFSLCVCTMLCYACVSVFGKIEISIHFLCTRRRMYLNHPMTMTVCSIAGYFVFCFWLHRHTYTHSHDRLFVLTNFLFSFYLRRCAKVLAGDNWKCFTQTLSHTRTRKFPKNPNKSTENQKRKFGVTVCLSQIN